MSDKTLRAVALIAASVGLILLCLALLVEPDLRGWGANVAIEVGATLFLFVPLLYLTKRLEGKIQKAEQKAAEEIESLAGQVAEAREEIRLTREQIAEIVIEELDEARAADVALFESVGGTPAQSDMAKALGRATSLGLITDMGCRVEIFETDLYVRFRPDYSPFDDPVAVELTIETCGGHEKDKIIWSGYGGETAIKVMVRIGQSLQKLGKFPGDTAFDPSKIFEDLKDALLVAHKYATGRGGASKPLGRVYQFCSPQWVITEDAVKKVSPFDNYMIHLDRLDELDWYDHVQARRGIDTSSLWDALESAKALWKSKRLVPSTRFYKDRLEDE